MSTDISSNSPKKEFLFALGGIVLFLGLVLIIGISAFLRPAGEHISAEPTAESVAVDESAAITAEATAPAQADATTATATTAEAANTDTVADATVTPTPSAATDDAIIATESGTATADGTVDQAAVANTDLTAEQADGDLEGAEPVAAQ